MLSTLSINVMVIIVELLFHENHVCGLTNTMTYVILIRQPSKIIIIAHYYTSFEHNSYINVE